jgi:hypothetical protein
MKFISIVLAASLMLSATACSVSKSETELTSVTSYSSESKSEVERLREKYPEYFELSAFKGIEIYVWEMAEGSYHCGLMSGTNRNKTEEEIWDLAKKPLTIEEAKLILNELKIDKEYWIIIPVVQPISSYRYVIDDAYREKVNKLFRS